MKALPYNADDVRFDKALPTNIKLDADAASDNTPYAAAPDEISSTAGTHESFLLLEDPCR